jgi:hypothetical protein
MQKCYKLFKEIENHLQLIYLNSIKQKVKKIKNWNLKILVMFIKFKIYNLIRIIY